LHLVGRDVAHGTLGPERLIVTPHAGLVIVEHVLGPALEHLELTRTRLWKEYRIAIPSAAGAPRLDQRADTLQIGVVTLSLLLGRRLRDEDFPARLAELVDEVCQPGPGAEHPPLSRAFGAWLVRALQLDLRHSFQSAIEAQGSLSAVLQDETRPAAVRLVSAPLHLALETVAHEPAMEVVHQEDVGRREEAADFGGLEPGSFRVRREPAYQRLGRAAGHLILRAAAVLVGVTAVLGLAYIAIHRFAPTWLPDHQPTVLTFGSQYAGAEVVIDGKARGRAPAEVSVKPGPHTIELRPATKPKLPPETAATGNGTSARPAARK
jgi:hypothetical protein